MRIAGKDGEILGQATPELALALEESEPRYATPVGSVRKTQRQTGATTVILHWGVRPLKSDDARPVWIAKEES